MQKTQIWKRTLSLLLLCCCIITSSAQQVLPKFSIVSFSEDPSATTATSSGYSQTDGNGSIMAIIKVSSADPAVSIDDWNSFTFDFGNMSHKTVVQDDELWIYVQKNARSVTIRREGYAPIKKFDLKTTIREGKNYEMKISFDKVEQRIVRTSKKQMLQIKVVPAVAGALVSLTREGEHEAAEVKPTDETGSVALNLGFGTYFYEVKLDKYQPGSGRLTLSNSEETYTEQVTLIPDFGYVEIKNPGNAGGAKVFVDNKEIGSVPYTGKAELDCGTHELMLVKDLYKHFTQTFTINRGETTVISPVLESNFAETTFLVDNNADIYIDGEYKSSGRWAGPLKAGTYLVECRKENHRPTQQQVVIEADKASTTTLEAPEPIVGFLSVMSSPSGAEIKIDGKSYGVTPRNINDMLIGKHKVEISMVDHKTETRMVNIEEGKECNLDVALGTINKVSFKSNASGANLYINNEYVGMMPVEKEMASGIYRIRATKDYGGKRYHRFSKSMNINVAHPNVFIKMRRQYMKKNIFYMGGDAQFGALNAFGGTMGFYAGNFNMEGSYLMGMKKEPFYWLSPEGGVRPQADEMTLQMCTGGKVGWGFILGTHVRITPQIGCNFIKMACDNLDAYVISGTAGLRFELALCKGLGIGIIPEYSVKALESDSFEVISDLPMMKDWTEGFNCRCEFFFFF